MTMLPIPILQTAHGRLFEGNCLPVLTAIADATVDLAFADPPFNLNKDYSSKIEDSLPDAEYLTWCREWLTQLIRTLKPGGSLFLYNLPKWNLPLGVFLMKSLTFRHWITVDMKYSLPIPKRLYPSNYSLLYFIKGPSPAVFHPDRLPIECCRHCGGERKVSTSPTYGRTSHPCDTQNTNGVIPTRFRSNSWTGSWRWRPTPAQS